MKWKWMKKEENKNRRDTRKKLKGVVTPNPKKIFRFYTMNWK